MLSPEVYKELFQSIFSYDWNCGHPKVILAYRRLIGNICTSNATYVLPALDMLVRTFAKPVQTPLAPSSSGSRAVIGTST